MSGVRNVGSMFRTADAARGHRSFRATGPTVFIFGNEVRGLSSALRARCDTLTLVRERVHRPALCVEQSDDVVVVVP